MPNDKNRITGRRTDAAYFEYQPFDQGSGLTGKYFNRPNQTNAVSLTSHHQPDAGQRSAHHVQPRRRLHSGEHGADRLQPRRSSASTIPYLMPNGKDIPTKSRPSACRISTDWPADPIRRIPRDRSGPARDTLTKVMGNHTFKVRVSLRVFRRKRWRPDQCEHRARRRQQPERHLHLHRCPNRSGRDLRHRHGQPGAGPGGQLHGNRSARAHHLARPGCARTSRRIPGRYATSCTSNTACAGPTSRASTRCGATHDYFDGALYNPANARAGEPDHRQRDPGHRQPV